MNDCSGMLKVIAMKYSFLCYYLYAKPICLPDQMKSEMNQSIIDVRKTHIKSLKVQKLDILEHRCQR